MLDLAMKEVEHVWTVFRVTLRPCLCARTTAVPTSPRRTEVEGATAGAGAGAGAGPLSVQPVLVTEPEGGEGRGGGWWWGGGAGTYFLCVRTPVFLPLTVRPPQPSHEHSVLRLWIMGCCCCHCWERRAMRCCGCKTKNCPSWCPACAPCVVLRCCCGGH